MIFQISGVTFVLIFRVKAFYQSQKNMMIGAAEKHLTGIFYTCIHTYIHTFLTYM